MTHSRWRVLVALALLFSLPLIVAACSPEEEGDDISLPDLDSDTESSPTPLIDFESILERILQQDETFERDASSTQPAVFVSENTAGQIDYEATEQYVTAVVQHADRAWTAWFLTNSLAEPWVGYEVLQPGESYTSNCPINGQTTFASNYPNAFYCGTDANTTDQGFLVLPVQTMANMWTGNIFNRQVSNLKRVGDFAAGMIVGHEFGHHVQDELSEQLNTPHPPNPQRELIADCFAGIWAYSIFLDNYLEAGDIEEALNALAVIGDNLGSHGTGEQRMNAFLIGYTGSQAFPQPGVPANCITAFWPNFGN